MTEYTLDSDEMGAVQFDGEKVASVSSYNENRGRPQRWTELDLYKTKAGQYVVQNIGRTQHENERDYFSVSVHKDSDDLTQFLGNRKLSFKLYQAANIKYVQRID